VDAKFIPMSEGMPLGHPLKDISTGWDGTLWGIDTNGVPYHLDPVGQSWQVAGRGYDAVARSRQGGDFIFFRGNEYNGVSMNPCPIGQEFPDLPDSFKLGVTGAAYDDGVLYLFSAGRYVRVDQPTSVVPLTSLADWPSTSDWADGSVDAVGSQVLPQGQTAPVMLFRGEQFLEVDLARKQVVTQPQPLTARFSANLLAVMGNGFDAVIRDAEVENSTGAWYVFQGPIRWVCYDAGTPIPEYASYAEEWLSKLIEAPRGRLGNLWGVGRNSTTHPFWFDGTDWHFAPFIPQGEVISLDVGVDGVVVALTTQNKLYQLDTDNSKWNLLATAAVSLAQVSVGSIDHIWVRDTNGRVYRCQSGNLSPSDLGMQAGSIAATPDGTLWFANGTVGTVYRYLPAGGAPPQPIGVGTTGPVTTVASNGFGSAYVLAGQANETQLFGYHSAYVFKTDGAYSAVGSGMGNSLVTGASTVFVNSSAGPVALDARTGWELWRVPNRFGGAAGIVFDPCHQQVFVNDGNISAFAPSSPDPVWTAQQVQGNHVDPMVLNQGVLYYGVRDDPFYNSRGTGSVVGLDITGAPQLPTVFRIDVDSDSIPDSNYWGITGIDSYAFDETTVYVGGRYTVRIGQESGVFVLAAASRAQSSVLWTFTQRDVAKTLGSAVQLTLGQAVFGAGPEPALFVVMEDRVVALQISSNGQNSLSFPAPAVSGGNGFTSGAAYSQGVFYVGDGNGTLYALDGHLKPVNNTPATLSAGHAVRSEILVVTDSAGTAHVLAATAGTQGVWLYNTAEATTALLATDQTEVTHLALDPQGHIVYTAGQTANDLSLGEVFAIRIADVVAAERAFTVDSQLLQDYDEPTPGTATSVSRYQTHVTVVDSSRSPLGRQSVKLWTDTASTVLIDGRSYTVDSANPARFETDGSGSFTVVSDATDLFVGALRLWASFMDPDERMVVHPDQAFHRRLTITTAGSDDDPLTVNLATAKSYDGAQLIPDNSEATNTAQAVRTLAASTGLGSSPAVSLAEGLWRRGLPPCLARTPATFKYLANPESPGVTYLATDTPVLRAPGITMRTGLVFEGGTFTQLPVAEAADHIDAMTGDTVLLLGVGSIFDSLADAWQEIKNAVTKEVKKVVVSIGDVISVGLHYVVQGAERVVKAVATTLEDVVAIVGAFFVQIGKDIAKVLEALSLFFDLDKILVTQRILRGFIDDMTKPDRPGNIADLLTAHSSDIRTRFQTLEQTISDDFEGLISQLNQKLPGPVSTAPGMGSTPSSVLTVTPSGGGAPQSHAVQGMWALTKVKQTMGQAKPASAPSSGTDPISDLFTGFIDNVENDPKLKAAYEQTRDKFHAHLTISSPEQLVAAAVTMVLELVKDAAVTGVALVGAFLDSLLDRIKDIVAALVNAGDIDIPVFSALWRQHTGQPLNIIDLITLVFAVPITYLYRALAGEWPTVNSAGSGLTATMAQILARLRGLGTALALIAAGVLTAVNDFLYITAAGLLTSGIVGRLVGGALLLLSLFSSCYAASQHPEYPYPQLACLAITNTLFVAFCSDLPAVVTILGFVIGVETVFFVWAKDSNEPHEVLAADVLAQVPQLVNPLKFIPASTLVPFLVPTADLAFRWAVAGINLDLTVKNWNVPGLPA
jgi:hypothetical protein